MLINAVSFSCRPWDLLQHAGLSGRSVLGHAGGQDLPAVPKRCGRHAGPQVLPGVFQMVSIPTTSQVVLSHGIAALHRREGSWLTHFEDVLFTSSLQGVAESCAIETAGGQ